MKPDHDGEEVDPLTFWTDMQKWFYRHTPGSPDWYHAIDHMMNVLIAEKVNSLKTAEGTEK